MRQEPPLFKQYKYKESLYLFILTVVMAHSAATPSNELRVLQWAGSAIVRFMLTSTLICVVAFGATWFTAYKIVSAIMFLFSDFIIAAGACVIALILAVGVVQFIAFMFVLPVVDSYPVENIDTSVVKRWVTEWTFRFLRARAMQQPEHPHQQQQQRPTVG